jgi:hypothetical protein
MAEVIEFPNSCTPQDRAECERALGVLERLVDKWAGEIDLPAMVKMLAKVSPAGLNNSAPETVRADFQQRQEKLIERFIEQAWIEGALHGSTGAFDAVRGGYDPVTRTKRRGAMVRVGDNQLRVLVMLGSPTMSLVVPGKECRSLIANGLLQVSPTGGFACITPKGLRALADEMDKGRVASALERMKADVEKRQAAIAARKT